MPARKLYDLAVKTRTYVDRDGKDKGVWENIGSVLQTDDGGKMILIKRSFNPAGVPFREGSDQIIVSMFEPKERDQAPPSQHQQSKQSGYVDDDIPF